MQMEEIVFKLSFHNGFDNIDTTKSDRKYSLLRKAQKLHTRPAAEGVGGLILSEIDSTSNSFLLL